MNCQGVYRKYMAWYTLYIYQKIRIFKADCYNLMKLQLHQNQASEIKTGTNTNNLKKKLLDTLLLKCTYQNLLFICVTSSVKR